MREQFKICTKIQFFELSRWFLKLKGTEFEQKKCIGDVVMCQGQVA